MNCAGSLMNFDGPIVMGILNVTPDSFFAESRISSEDQLLQKAAKMVEEGAHILDIGGYSSRPGAKDISVEEEVERTATAIKSLKNSFPNILISIDTFRSKVAIEAVKNGADIVNDISGGQLDEKMFETVAQLNVPYIMMHMKGTPQNMKSLNQYKDLIQDIQLYFSQQISKARKAGIKDIIIDPGFGFSKDVGQNFQLMKQLELLHLHDCPILVGISRKSMIYKSLNITSDESLNGTTVLNTIALSKGAAILRVHDVKEAVESVKLGKLIHCEESQSL
ncbi:dihydropteroate synthase [Paracrocinitomix mangrovi]|nr:dihydropteroate synthase [Paracrocinitomix mangrovi]UKN03883.1 dihydropteroate synthase [Paracrocinitomix mangrovi]